MIAHFRMSIFRWEFACITFLLHCLCGESKALTLEVTGGLIGRHLQGDRLLMTASNWFKATLDEHSCNLKIGPTGANGETKYHEYGMLGDDSYVLCEFDTNHLITEYIEMHDGVAKHLKLDQPFPPANEAMLFITPEKVPGFNVTFLAPVWLAYGFRSVGGHHSGKMSSRPIFPVISDFVEQGGRADTEYTMNPASPCLLLRWRELVHPRELMRLNLHFQSPTGFTNCAYETTAWTNVSGWTIPARFQTIRYLIDRKFGVFSQETMVFEGTALSIRICDGVPALLVPKVTRVVERRPQYVKPYSEYSYTTTDGTLWDRERLKAHGEHSAILAVSTGRTHWIVYVLFAIVALLPAIWLVRKRLVQARNGVS